MNLLGICFIGLISVSSPATPSDFGDWEFRPKRINNNTGDGWTQMGEGEGAFMQAASTLTERTYYWRVFQDIELVNERSVSLQLRVRYAGAPYEWFRVLIGPEGSTRIDEFNPIYTLTAESPTEKILTLPLNEHIQNRRFRIMLAVRKPHQAQSDQTPLIIREVAVVRDYESSAAVSARADEPAPPPAGPIAPVVQPTVSPMASESPLKIASFNVQVFGLSKLRKPIIRRALIDIIQRYDLLLFQEIRDQSETAILSLLQELNRKASGAYEVIMSGRMGSTDMKEQYAYFYRASRLEVQQYSTYGDDDRKKRRDFERPPFMAHFRSTESDLDFSVAGVHVDPDEVEHELDSLVDVYEDVVDRYGDEDVLLMGDFNADCQYLKEYELEDNRLWTDDRLHWNIDNDADTTTGKNTCAFDRFVSSQQLQQRVVHNSPRVFRFEPFVTLPPGGVRKVSDHYPIEISLRL